MNLTNQLGHLTELWCQIDFCERGIVLSQPTQPASRYDFIAEIGNKLYRIQCKTAHKETNNRISITVMSKNWNSGMRRSYVGEIDYFYTRWNNQGYLIPIELCNEKTRTKVLRLGEPSDYHSNNCDGMYGKDYEIDKILNQINNSFSYDRITIENADRSVVQKLSNELNDVKKSKKNHVCEDCDAAITNTAKKCVECYNKKIHSCIPQRDELKDLIRTMPFTKIGEKYGKTDNAIRKWCKYYSLPHKKSDIKKISDTDWLKI